MYNPEYVQGYNVRDKIEKAGKGTVIGKKVNKINSPSDKHYDKSIIAFLVKDSKCNISQKCLDKTVVF